MELVNILWMKGIETMDIYCFFPLTHIIFLSRHISFSSASVCLPGMNDITH